MKKKNKEEKNLLHTEYGILKNSVYILGKIRQYKPFLPWLMLLGVFTGSLMQYLWTFIGKFVIDIIECQASSAEKDFAPLLSLLIITTIIELIAMGLNTLANNRIWFNMINVRMKMISERIRKVLSMEYQTLENPDILNMAEKAAQATGGNNNGVEGMMHSVYGIGTNIVLMAVTLTTIVTLDWKLIIILTVVSFLQFLFFKHIVKRDKKEVWDKLAPTWRKINYMERATQDFDYAKDIRLFGMKNWLSDKQHEILDEKQSKILHSRNLWMKNAAFSNLIGIISKGAVYAILIYSVIDTDMSIGNFTLFLGLSSTFSSTLTAFLNSLGQFKEQSMKTDDFRSFLDYESELENDTVPLPQSGRYTFEFKNVSYRYKGAEEYALKNLNLTFEAGKRLAVVGLNGAGKTTFIKLLLRLYDVTEGEILLNGVDIRRFKRNEYYTLFAPVFQNVEIFAFPMSENISMKPPCDTDAKLAEKCAVKAGMEEKLNSLSDGIATELLKVIHDDGVDLSGGEKQKLALARVLYKNAPVIVLDEPTAALDALAEYSLYKNFDEIIGDKSAIYISHRLSSTRFCDSIAMFKAGEMVEYGTHEELLAKGGAYSEMFNIQAQYYKEGEKEYEEIG